MFYLISFLHGVFGLLKGVESGYTTNNKNAMLIKHQGKVYKAEFTELGEGEVEEYLEQLKY